MPPPGSAEEAGDGIYQIALGQAPGNSNDAHVYIEVADVQGNITRIDRKFSIEAGMLFKNGFEW